MKSLTLHQLVPLFVFVLLVGCLAAAVLSGRNPSHIPTALRDKPVPAFSLPILDRKTGNFTDQDLKQGKPVLVNVFASWCVPCRAEHPQLMALQEKGITVYGLNYKDTPNAALPFLWELGDPYDKIGEDTDGRVAIEWGVAGVPESFIIDGRGVIRWKITGPIMERDLEKKVLPLLRELGA